MKQVSTPNGVANLYDKYDLIDLVRSYISDDVADYVDENFRHVDSEELRTELEFNSDYEALEVQVDELCALLWDVHQELEHLRDGLLEQRVNKGKLLRIISELRDKCMEVM